MKISRLDHALTDWQRSERLFSGELLIYRQRPAMHQLIALADQMLREALNGLEPSRAQARLSREQFLQLTGQVQAGFRRSEDARALFFEVLRQCGVDTAETGYDHFPLRVVPFDTSHQGAMTAAIGHHRDSWGSNIHSQQNWWAPIYPLEPQRSITFYPHYWRQPLANNTRHWSFEDYLASREQSELERAVAYPSAPGPEEPVNEQGAVQIMLEPGDVLNFASAHLHASAINTTAHTRFSVEMRTIYQPDIAAQRSAPNIDNEGTPAMYQWFKNIESKQLLTELL